MHSILAAFFLMALATGGAPGERRREPVVGLPCEGCEAIFEGLPEHLESMAVIAPRTEPGRRLLVKGVVRTLDGKPRPGVVIYAYHTNGKGRYPTTQPSTGLASHRHGLLRAWVVTDEHGRYGFDTIRPGGYPGTNLPEHIHMHVLEPGCATYYIDDILFTDDPRLTPETAMRFAAGRGGSGMVTPTATDGQWTVQRDIVLGKNIPAYPGCSSR